MKKALLFSLLVFNTVFGQSNYILYHQNCRKAERFFIEKQGDSSLALYQHTFTSFEYLFPRDCFMAAQIAHESQQDSLAIEFLIVGFRFGIRIESIEQDSTSKLHQLTTLPIWKRAQYAFPEKYAEYLSALDQPLKQTINGFVEKDQQIRIKNNKWFNRTFRPWLENEFDRMNDEHLRFLDSVCKQRGYPGSWLIGIGDSLVGHAKNATQINSNLNECASILAYHNDSVNLKMGDFLYGEIAKGHIHPRVYAMIRDFQDRHLVKKEDLEQMYYNIWWERQNFTETEFEAHCMAIGCPTKKHQRQLNEALGKGYDSFWSPFR